jgi:translation initiation factor 3 subunit M
VEAAVGAIRDPVTLISEQRNMMSMPAIVGLSKDAATKPLYSLLEIFAEGKLEDYKNFETSYAKVFTQYDLSKEECIRHMRLLSLCSLASEHEEVPYSAIASTLQIDDCDVEKWVIEAVSTGLISAKMDQLQKVVMIEQCVVRKFGTEQWRALQTKLHAWRKNVKTVLDGLKTSHAVQESM